MGRRTTKTAKASSPRTPTGTGAAAQLRAEAEAVLARGLPVAGGGTARSANVGLHDLQVLQIELEMQNEALRENQLALEESRNRYLDLYEFAPVGYLSLTGTGQIVEANLTAAALLDVDRSKLRECRFESLVADEERERWHRQFGSAWERQGTHSLDLKLKRGRDGWFHAGLKYQCVRGEDALPTLRMAFADLTERKHAEALIRASEERLALALDATADGIWDWDLRSGVVYRSPRYYEVVGRKPDADADDFEFFKATVHPDDLPQVLAAIEAHKQGKTPAIAFEYRLASRSGDSRWMEVKGRAVVRNAEGLALRMVGTIADISARKLAELALAAREAEYRAVTETAADGIWMLDQEGRLLAVNDAYVRRSGYSREQLLTMRIGDLDATESPDEVRAHIEKVRRQGGDIFETRHRTKDGEIWPAEVRASYSAMAGVERYFGFLRDLTEQKRSEAALQTLRAEMEEAMRFHVARQTVAAIAHELNQPLNALTTLSAAALRMLHDGNPKPDKLQHALEINVQQAHRAGRVVQELLEFMDKGEVTTEPVDLNHILRSILSRVAENGPRAFKSRVYLEPDLPAVRANRLQVEKVVSNLIQNGVEAMQGAGIHPKNIVLTVRSSADASMAQVTVRDGGPGLNAQTMHRIFDPFFTTKLNGLGMGLAISRAIIEAHGGQLWVDAEPGAGAVFHFTLPFAT